MQFFYKKPFHSVSEKETIHSKRFLECVDAKVDNSLLANVYTVSR